MRYRVELLPAARRDLGALPRPAQVLVGATLAGLADDPRPAGVSKLVGLPDVLRVRVGEYRILYQVHEARVLVLVVRVGDRRDVYRSTELRRLRRLLRRRHES